MTQTALERTLAVIFLFTVAMASLGILVYDVISNIPIQFYILPILYAAVTSAATVAGIQVSSGAATKASNATADALSKGVEVGAKLTNGNGNGNGAKP